MYAKALESFCRTLAVGRTPCPSIFRSALRSCSKNLAWHFGWQIHAHIIRSGYEQDMFLGSALVNFYANHNALVNARTVFYGMKKYDQVLWTSLLSGLSQNGHGREAILLFKEMLSTDNKPDDHTYVSVISACRALDCMLEQVVLLHAHVTVLGFINCGYVLTSLIDSYSKLRKVDRAALLFHSTTEKDVSVASCMISGYSYNNCNRDALKLFVKMRRHGLGLSVISHTLTSILNSCGNITVIQLGRQVHSLVIKSGFFNNIVGTALVDMYSKCGSIDEARMAFDHVPERNQILILCTSLMTGYAQNGRSLDALQLFDHLVSEVGLIPDHICFTAVLSACNHAGLVEKGIKYFNQIKEKYGLVPDVEHYSCLIDIHTRNGHLRKAKELMDEMPYLPSRGMWCSFLRSCKEYGAFELGNEAADKILKMKFDGSGAYATAANIYGQAGLWGKVVETRKSMEESGIKKNAGWSWIEE